MHQSNSVKRHSESGQGLVEYSIILALLALVVVVVLVVFGPGVGNIFSESSKAFNMAGEAPVEDTVDVITIAQVDYYNGSTVHIDAQVDGSSDPNVTLTASPGGEMQILDSHYHILFSLPGCPCEVTITSSTGGSTTVMVEP